MFCIVHLPMFLLYILLHLHLTALEPAIKEAIVIGRNPIVQKEAKAAFKGAAKIVSNYEKKRKQRK